MIAIGKTNQLKVVKMQGPNVYLGKPGSPMVLVADKKPSKTYQIGDSVTAYVYVDGDGHLAATTQKPLAEVGDIAWLKGVAVNYYGAFLDWGVPKDLLVPFNEQTYEMKAGKHYLVTLFTDTKDRIVATAKIERFLSDTATDLQVGQSVSLIIADHTELGIKAVARQPTQASLPPAAELREVGEKLALEELQDAPPQAGVAARPQTASPL